jgi:hypothetical protein
LAGRVLLKIVYLVTCRVLGVAVLVFRGDRVKAAELLVLRRRLVGGHCCFRCHSGPGGHGACQRALMAAL